MNTNDHLETKAATVDPPTKRVILSMGGKGGVSKTSVMAGLADLFQETRFRSRSSIWTQKTSRAGR
jgi:hypothetical protein